MRLLYVLVIVVLMAAPTGVAMLTAPTPAWANDSAPAELTAPDRPKTKLHTKRTIDNTTVIDLCTLANVRECTVWNQTDVAIVVKYVAAGPGCTDVPIDTAADTDVTRIPAGASFSDVIGEKSNGVDHTLCGKAAAVVVSGHVYTVEAS